MLTLYTNPRSPPSNRVVFTANALGYTYENNVVDLRSGDQKNPNYLKINPIGKVPAMDDDGFTLAESHAIMKYLAKKAGRLYPSDIKEQAELDMMMDFIAIHLNVNLGKIMFNRLFAAMRGMTPNEESIKDGENFLNQQLPIIEERLTNSPYLMGDEMSLADISLISVLDPMDAVQFSLMPYPKIRAFRENMMKQPFYTALHSYYGENILPPSQQAAE